MRVRIVAYADLMRTRDLSWLALILTLVTPGCGDEWRYGEEFAAPPLSLPATQPAATSPATQPATQPDGPIRISDDIVIFRGSPKDARLEVQAETPLEEGWLEQVACSPDTRVHESLLVISAKPSALHAALLAAGFESGSPGRWTYDKKTFGAIDPTGSKLDLVVRYIDEAGKAVEQSIRQWMRDPKNPSRRPDQPWVFGGSSFQPNPPSMGPGEHYVADFSGSIIGLVTFGDEVIGYGRVLADDASVQDPVWEADPDTMPPPGTKVTLIIRPFAPPATRPATPAVTPILTPRPGS